jgi:hypothetical protein
MKSCELTPLYCENFKGGDHFGDISAGGMIIGVG